MKTVRFLALALTLISATALAGESPLEVRVSGIKSDGVIPQKFAYCIPDEITHTRDGSNINPEVSWLKGPAGTKSYAMIVHDSEVPIVFDDANKEERVIQESLKRMDFYHWVLIDIPVDRTSIAEGEDSNGVNTTGKSVGQKPYGLSGKNDYTLFKGSTFGGYDGPCPPWNDEKLHKYHFTVYALDLPTLGLSGEFGGKEALKAIEGHVLAKGVITGSYTQNLKLLIAKK